MRLTHIQLRVVEVIGAVMVGILVAFVYVFGH
jgi:hypothetical protein